MSVFDFTFSIGDTVEMKDGNCGTVEAIEMTSPRLGEPGLGVFVAANMNDASLNIQRFVDTGLFCIRYGIQFTKGGKISFHPEHFIVGGTLHPFGKGSTEYVRENFIREIEVLEKM